MKFKWGVVMIVRLRGADCPYRNCEALEKRAWRYSGEAWSDTTDRKSTPHLCVGKKVNLSICFLLFSGFSTGMGMILWSIDL